VQEGYQAVYEAAEGIDPTLKGPIFAARNEGFKGAAEVEKKIRQHVKLKEETELEQIEKAAANLAPDGKPQERVLNVHQYLARYGDGLIPAILERMEVELDGAEGWDGWSVSEASESRGAVMMWSVVLILVLLIPLTAVVLDSRLGQAMARRVEGGRRTTRGCGRWRSEVERLGKEMERLQEQSEFLTRSCWRSGRGPGPADPFRRRPPDD
jgi:hypothetical protein